MNEKDIIKNVLTRNSVDKEKIRQHAKIIPNTERRIQMKNKKVFVAICVCICLIVGAGTTAFAIEARSYNVAVEYLKDLGIGVDGYSRKEIKLVYQDINSGAFEKELTVTILAEKAQAAGIDTQDKNAKELYNEINGVGQSAETARITTEQVKKITSNMKYNDVISLLGKTADVGSGTYILQYEVDGNYTLEIVFTSMDAPCGYSGSELLNQLKPKS